MYVEIYVLDGGAWDACNDTAVTQFFTTAAARRHSYSSTQVAVGVCKR